MAMEGKVHFLAEVDGVKRSFVLIRDQINETKLSRFSSFHKPYLFDQSTQQVNYLSRDVYYI
jgi:hypothetical protein